MPPTTTILPDWSPASIPGPSDCSRARKDRERFRSIRGYPSSMASRRLVLGFLLCFASAAQPRIDEKERARMEGQSHEPGGTLEKDLWQVLVLMGVDDT